MTPRQSGVLATVVEGMFGVAWFGLLVLLLRGYYTLFWIIIIPIGLILGIGALTSIFNRRRALSGLAAYTTLGMLSLWVQGSQALFLTIILTACVIVAVAFIYHDGHNLWRWWFPDQLFGPTVKRWLRYLGQAIVAAVAYVHMRVYINYLTGVDPGNFPTALTALTALNTIIFWLLFLPFILFVMAGLWAFIAWAAGIRGESGPAEIAGVSAARWGFRAAGAVSLMFIGGGCRFAHRNAMDAAGRTCPGDQCAGFHRVFL